MVERQRWEYLQAEAMFDGDWIIAVVDGKNIEERRLEYNQYLQDMGKEGWELISANYVENDTLPIYKWTGYLDKAWNVEIGKKPYQSFTEWASKLIGDGFIIDQVIPPKMENGFSVSGPFIIMKQVEKAVCERLVFKRPLP